jgi:hypothetical protein
MGKLKEKIENDARQRFNTLFKEKEELRNTL